MYEISGFVSPHKMFCMLQQFCFGFFSKAVSQLKSTKKKNTELHWKNCKLDLPKKKLCKSEFPWISKQSKWMSINLIFLSRLLKFLRVLFLPVPLPKWSKPPIHRSIQDAKDKSWQRPRPPWRWILPFVKSMDPSFHWSIESILRIPPTENGWKTWWKRRHQQPSPSPPKKNWLSPFQMPQLENSHHTLQIEWQFESLCHGNKTQRWHTATCLSFSSQNHRSISRVVAVVEGMSAETFSCRKLDFCHTCTRHDSCLWQNLSWASITAEKANGMDCFLSHKVSTLYASTTYHPFSCASE